MEKRTLIKILSILSIIVIIAIFGFSVYMGYFTTSKYAQGLAFPKLTFDKPLNLVTSSDTNNDFYVIEQEGKIYRFANDRDADKKSLFLDIGEYDDFYYDWEGGLLGLEFHPDFENNGIFFIYYTKDDPSRTVENDDCDPCILSVLEKYTVDQNNPSKANRSSAEIILSVPQFVLYHRAGQLNFGSDGYLYVNIGDSLRGGQNLTEWYGKILRIDIDTKDPGLNYGIPTDNPFYNNSQGYKEEIYAYGFRNPWRASFDDITNSFWVADVGLDAYEEINFVEKGENYGWDLKEGPECVYYRSNCNTTGLVDPVLAYGHEYSSDEIYGDAVIGGYVYRGTNFPDLYGKYVFVDYNGWVWALSFDFNKKEVTNYEKLTRFPDAISSIGIDNDNELYFTGHFLGTIFQLKHAKDTLSSTIMFIFVIFIASLLISILWQMKRNKIEWRNLINLKREILQNTIIIFGGILIIVIAYLLIRLLFYSLDQS